jgi:intracellular septation protein A
MDIRQITAKALFGLALPFVFLGLIDPLEGGIALMFAAVIYLIAFWAYGQMPSKLLWIPFVSAVAIGMATLGIAIANLEFSQQPEGLPAPVIFGLWAYRLAVAATLVGAVTTLIKSLRSKR